MEVIFKGETREIADFIRTIRSQQEPESVEIICDGETIHKVVHDAEKKGKTKR